MYALSLKDGTTTATFTGAPDVVLDYVPKAAPAGAVEVAESFKVAIVADTLGLALAEREVAGRLLAQAARVQAGSGEARVYLEARRSVDQPAWQCEVLGGSVQELDEVGYWPGRGVVRCAVSVTRRAYWQGELVEAGLLVGTEYVTGGKNVKNYWSNGHVDLDDLVGELPTPLRIMLQVVDAGFTIKRVYAALRSVASVGAFTHSLEAENVAYGTYAESTLASGGAYCSMTLEAGEVLVSAWPINDAQQLKAGGRAFRVLARWLEALGDAAVLLQARLKLGTLLLWAGPWVSSLSTHELTELGSVVLPPDGLAVAARATLTLELWANTAEGETVKLDYVLLLGLDAFRRYDDLGGGLAAVGDYLFDDPQGAFGSGPEGQLYAMTGGGLTIVGTWYAAGAPLLARPGYQHRLCLAWEGATGSARADKQAKVRVWYRPRVVVP